MNNFPIENIKSFDEQKLCAIIVAYKYFNNHFDVIEACMNELAERRRQGSKFEFEEYIQQEYNKLPKLDNKIDIRNILSSIDKLRSK